MLAAKGIRHACPCYNASSRILLTRWVHSGDVAPRKGPRSISASVYRRSHITTNRPFTTTRCRAQEASVEKAAASTDHIERTVRDAKQRFRDTLPKDYLTDEEYALYVRLYGPPLRETEPEDVGIPTHIDMDSANSRSGNEGTVLKERDGGGFEEITYEMPKKLVEELDAEAPEHSEDIWAQLEAESLIEKPPGYVESVARNQREHDALQRLVQDFERTQREQEAAEHKAAIEEEEAQRAAIEESGWPPEEEDVLEDEGEIEEWELEEPQQRYHPYTLDGSFHGRSVEIAMPRKELVEPIAELLSRTHIDHVRDAAESMYGGPGLPTSAETVLGRRAGHMGGVGLLADQRHMTEIEADAFLAGFMPGAYASVFSVLREVRKRVGSEFIQSKLRNEGPGLSVLDAGSGGAGLIAWEQIVKAEWELLKDKGEARGYDPPGKKTVIAPSDRLRNRLKTFLHNTTFLPRLPDYEHSGEMRGPRLDGGSQEQPRKTYDVIIASHLFLRESQDHRRQALLNNLWHLLKKDGGVLIVLEKAHPRGFEAVAHARDTLINQFLLPPSGEPRIAPEDFNSTFHREPEPGHIIAPCTNQGTCPMYVEKGKSRGRKDYCHFNQRFVRPNFYTKLLRKKTDNQGDVEFSYVAIQRGVAKTTPPSGKEATDAALAGYEHSESPPDMQTLPRLVMRPLKRKGHVTMDVCTPQGKIERWTVPKSFSKLAYHDARKSRWGDLWALGAKTRVAKNIRSGKADDEGVRASDGKKPRKVSISMEGGRVTSTTEKNVGRERRGKGKGTNRDILEELRRAEDDADEALSQEIDGDLVAELEADEARERRQR